MHAGHSRNVLTLPALLALGPTAALVAVGFNWTYRRQFRGEVKDLRLFGAAREQ